MPIATSRIPRPLDGEFLAWLRTILVNNIAREVERHILSANRDVRREVRLDRMHAALERSAARLEAAFVDRASSPSTDRSARTCRRPCQPLGGASGRLSRRARAKALRRAELQGSRRADGPLAGAVRMLWLRAMEMIRQRMNQEETP